MMDVDEVRSAAREGRVAQAPQYHAGRHGLAWPLVLYAMEQTYQVRTEDRRDRGGRLLHPRGYMAWARLASGRIIRVDFNLHHGERGDRLLVVTAFEVDR